MYLSRMLRCFWRLLALAPLVGACALIIGAQGAGAASVSGQSAARPLVGCAPCISSVDPAPNGTVKADASGKVTLKFGAQMTSPFVKFVLTLDGTAVDSTKIQVTSNDPLQPSGSYTAALAAGQHTAKVEVDDANGPEATFPGWNFTVQAAPVTPTPTRTPAGNSGGNGS
ncbi:MAG TPA: Ig-like domain-containing protein, partial [Ktedonobacterales bacterium]